ncbi:hypothetical protein [Streptomyces flaveus]|uniref:hypothetical protein n=1 Tax=Streptomyces flaveus TaxID=66370 RepID=UPI003330A756
MRGHGRHTVQPVATYSYIGSHLALAVAPTEKWICSGNQDASIHCAKLPRTRDGSELTMSGYPEKVSRLAFDDTGFWLAADGAPDLTVFAHEDWASWWTAVADDPELADLLAERRRRTAISTGKGGALPLSGHLSLLREAGFGQAGPVWQYGESYLVVAVR